MSRSGTLRAPRPVHHERRFRMADRGHWRRMSENDPTGYRESPDTTDGTAPETDDAPQGSGTLTTDEDAQRDEGIARPGNEAD
jgi:hypothetical protein